MKLESIPKVIWSLQQALHELSGQSLPNRFSGYRHPKDAMGDVSLESLKLKFG